MSLNDEERIPTDAAGNPKIKACFGCTLGFSAPEWCALSPEPTGNLAIDGRRCICGESLRMDADVLADELEYVAALAALAAERDARSERDGRERPAVGGFARRVVGGAIAALQRIDRRLS